MSRINIPHYKHRTLPSPPPVFPVQSGFLSSSWTGLRFAPHRFAHCVPEIDRSRAVRSGIPAAAGSSSPTSGRRNLLLGFLSRESAGVDNAFRGPNSCLMRCRLVPHEGPRHVHSQLFVLRALLPPRNASTQTSTVRNGLGGASGCSNCSQSPLRALAVRNLGVRESGRN